MHKVTFRRQNNEMFMPWDKLDYGMIICLETTGGKKRDSAQNP